MGRVGVHMRLLETVKSWPGQMQRQRAGMAQAQYPLREKGVGQISAASKICSKALNENSPR